MKLYTWNYAYNNNVVLFSIFFYKMLIFRLMTTREKQSLKKCSPENHNLNRGFVDFNDLLLIEFMSLKNIFDLS